MRIEKMHILQKSLLLYVLLLTIHLSLKKAIAQETQFSCGKIRTQTYFFPLNSTQSALLNRMVLCKSQKPYFRTSLGLFPISSIDYKTKLLTISHKSCSSSSQFVSPSHLSAGFPPPPQPNSLILFNCSNPRFLVSPYLRNCPQFHGCKACFPKFNEEEIGANSCLIVDYTGIQNMGFDPKDLNCSHYSRVYRNTLVVDEFELGTRISFDIPDHVPNPCDQCEKPHGNCGVGLRCICHPKECKDKVISMGVKVNPLGNTLFSLLCFSVLRDLFKGS